LIEPTNVEKSMLNKVLLMSAGLMVVSGIALADADGDLSNPSTTGTDAMEQPSSEIRDPAQNQRDGMVDRDGEMDSDSELGTMGTGATGTTGGMGATTGTDTIEDRDDETDP
jgi:hypothetical protein